jgi:hypothetical protein
MTSDTIDRRYVSAFREFGANADFLALYMHFQEACGYDGFMGSVGWEEGKSL